MRCSVVFGVTLRLLVINISSSSPQSTPPLTTSDVSQLARRWPWSTGDLRLQHLASCSVNTGSQARYRLRIAISADYVAYGGVPLMPGMYLNHLLQHYHFCLPHLHSMPPLGGFRRNIAIPFGTEKLEWCGYPTVGLK